MEYPPNEHEPSNWSLPYALAALRRVADGIYKFHDKDSNQQKAQDAGQKPDALPVDQQKDTL